MDQALRTRHKGVRRVTALILLAGLAVVAFIMLRPERRRERLVGDIELMADSASVRALLGTPGATCTTGGLEHLGRRFPTGTPPAMVGEVTDRLQRETAQRWVYPLDEDGRAGCVPPDGATEVGLDRQGRVLWYVPVTGRVALVVPEGYLPSAVE
ncbi:MAG TPA: hypothetical protein VK399_06740 [Longimicrobiaceae bacterium]|nr:hypothetical protein [Longimicrobiaceae bacterium]